jgi:hypothetical protein
VNTPQKGELAELGFIYEIKQRKLGLVLLPFSMSSPYDVAIDNGDRIIRVQVKSAHVTTTRPSNGRQYYMISCGCRGGECRNKQHYKKGDFDVLAATVMPLHAWYLIEADVAILRTSLNLYPDCEDMKDTALWEQYRDNWSIFN